MLINFKNGKFNLKEHYGCCNLSKEVSLHYDFFIHYIVNWEHIKKTFSLPITEFSNLKEDFFHFCIKHNLPLK
jgi:hypothetical protein